MLSKFFQTIRRRLKSDGFNSFIHFFATFTGIFLIMTVLILQIMSYGVYSSVDASLKSAANNANTYMEMEMAKTSILSVSSNGQSGTTTVYQTFESPTSSPESSATETESSAPSKKEKKGKPPEGLSMAANTSILVMDKDNNILNSVDGFSSLSNLDINTKRLDLVQEGTATNYFNQKENYRFITVAVSSDVYPNASCVTIAINTTQLDEANERYKHIIIMVMVFFWIMSVAASLYLAKWSRKPIQESLEKQKAFVENASHELRTPLAVIQNRLEALFRKPESTILDNSEHIASSLDEVRNMRLLTTNLLNLARRDDGIKPEIETIPASFFDDVFENYDMIADENGKSFVGTNQVARSINTDRTLLKQLMTILFDNAIKYTDADGQVALTVRATDRHLFISVADNGPGISDSDKKKIFDRFYRVDKARTRQKGGFGLGLSLAQQIVLALKGTITVKDNQPKGTIFEVKLNNV